MKVTITFEGVETTEELLFVFEQAWERGRFAAESHGSKLYRGHQQFRICECDMTYTSEETTD